ncbi:hypothetical protein ACRSLK_11545 [Halopseudomonas pachastrellae]|uniref:hypothetical protein n=1 Tax=Halopseudomonas pachastrellae TaxID=254161 RepID=UPI003D7C72F1
MQFYGLALIAAVVAGLLVLLILRYGWRLRWLTGWLQGNLLLLGLLLATAVGLLAWDLQHFKVIEARTVGTLSFSKVGDQQYDAVLTGAGEEQRVRLAGDLWELEVQVLRWHGLANLIGLQDGYRLHRLLGRYLALEQQRDAGDALAANFNHAPPWRDIWDWADRLETHALVQADAFEVRFIPLVDGARFALEIGPTGLTPEPLNAQARTAMKGL